MGIQESMRGLCESVQVSPEFSKLKQAKAVIARNPALKKEMDEFNAVQKRLYSGNIPASEAEATAKRLDAKYESLSKMAEVQSYLQALEDFNRLMAKIYSGIGEALEKNL